MPELLGKTVVSRFAQRHWPSNMKRNSALAEITLDRTRETFETIILTPVRRTPPCLRPSCFVDDDDDEITKKPTESFGRQSGSVFITCRPTADG